MSERTHGEGAEEAIQLLLKNDPEGQKARRGENHQQVIEAIRKDHTHSGIVRSEKMFPLSDGERWT